MRFTLLFILIITNFNSCKYQETMKIIYVYDALCGWCYGFTPVMSQFENKYKDTLEFEVISGGMITGDRIGAIGDVASYISWAYKDVENATGVKFGRVFLDQTLKKGTPIFTSIPPAIALSVFKSKNSNNNLKFASALQKAIYYDGIEPENISEYATIAEKFGLDKSQFLADMRNEKFLLAAQNDFKKTKELNVTGFPNIFVMYQNKYYQIASGYVSFETLEKNFLQIKNNIK